MNKKLSIIFTLATLFCIYVSASAQRINNVRFEQVGQNVNIYYDINNAGGQSFDISVYYSLDGGQNFYSKISDASGDIGSPVGGGPGKKVTWNAQNEVGQLHSNQVMFKVVGAPNKTSFEPKTLLMGDVEMTITKAEVKSGILFIHFEALSNAEKRANVELYKNDARIFDTQSREYKENFHVKIGSEQSNNSLRYTFPPGIKVHGTFKRPNIPADFTKIALFEFTFDNQKYQLKDIPVTRN